jgi:hypothetical protein
MGVVDCYRLPKSTFYLYRYNWRGVADDNPVTGLTPAGLRLEADTNKLIADSVDCAFFYASIRDANGTCVHTGYNTTSTTNVTFSVTGPANWFGPLTVKVNGGKCALLVKSTNTPGTICVTATTAGLPQAQTCIASEAPDTTPLPFIASVITGPFTPSNKNIAIKRQANTLRIIFPVKGVSVDDASIINMRGQKMSCPAVVNGTILTIDTKRLAAGSYYLSISRKTYNIKEIRRVLIAR